MTNDELRTLIESNARSIQANAERNRELALQSAETDRKINNLANIVQAFISKLDSEGLKVTLITDVVDDATADVNRLERNQNNLVFNVETLRQDAIADRLAWQRNFDAQLQILQSQLLEMGRLNRRLDNLDQAS